MCVLGVSCPSSVLLTIDFSPSFPSDKCECVLELERNTGKGKGKGRHEKSKKNQSEESLEKVEVGSQLSVIVGRRTRCQKRDPGARDSTALLHTHSPPLPTNTSNYQLHTLLITITHEQLPHPPQPQLQSRIQKDFTSISSPFFSTLCLLPTTNSHPSLHKHTYCRETRNRNFFDSVYIQIPIIITSCSIDRERDCVRVDAEGGAVVGCVFPLTMRSLPASRSPRSLTTTGKFKTYNSLIKIRVLKMVAFLVFLPDVF